jgi:tetratricopeptide (TPR) repeat protein
MEGESNKRVERGTVMIRIIVTCFVAGLSGCSSAPEKAASEKPPLEKPGSKAMSEAEKYYREGTDLLKTDAEKAVELLTKSLELGPDAPPALYNRATAYASLGRAEEALADVKRLEKVAPKIGAKLRLYLRASAVPYTDIAVHEFKAGKLKEALKACDQAIIYDPELADAWVVKGIVLKKLGETDKALDCYNKAAAAEPDSYEAYINRAELHSEQKRFDQALADFSKAIGLRPDEPSPYSGRAAVYAALEMPKLAEADRAKAAQLETKAKDSKEP